MSSPTAAPALTVAIIGGGLMGCSIANELARRGHDVTVLDKGPGPGHGSTSASSAIVRFHYSTLGSTALAYEGMHYWRHWDDHIGFEPELGLVEFVTTGLAVLADQNGHAARCLGNLETLGIPHEWWDTAELARRMPYLSTAEFWPPCRPEDDAFFAEPTSELLGALYEVEAGYVSDPQLAAQNLHDAAVVAGATFSFRTEVVAVRRDDERVLGVTLAGGKDIDVEVVINAAGPFSATVNDLAGLTGSMKIGTRPMRQEVHHVDAPAIPHGDDVLPGLGDGDSGYYYRSDPHGHLYVGSVEPECDPLEWIDDPDTVDLALGSQWEVQTLRVARRIPEVGVPLERRGVVGVYDVSDDWAPIYDRTDLDGFYVAIGTSGNQFKNGGVVGHLMAELIESVEGGHDHDADPITIVGQHTGLAIDLATFARNRAFNATTASVLG